MHTHRTVTVKALSLGVWLLLAACAPAASTRPAEDSPATEESPPATETPDDSQTNQPPAWPEVVQIETGTDFEYDGSGLLMGGVTTITILTPATDPDGDPITYIWKGKDVDHTDRSGEATTYPSQIESDGLTAIWTRIILMGELASAFITVTASDGRGGTADYGLCIGNYVSC